ncbi:MAG: hypothetical protein RBR71_06795 [Gudongella sp.]|nr:hypothetical protein [Gudongella sp.]
MRYTKVGFNEDNIEYQDIWSDIVKLMGIRNKLKFIISSYFIGIINIEEKRSWYYDV